MTDQEPARLGGGSRAATPGASDPPLLSILIVVFRDREELVEIIRSILPFRCAELEIVVVDGFSQDGTAEALHALGDAVDFWLSEPDTGIYDAMNKGLGAARGTYVLHLNAGDRLLHVPWQELRRCAAENVDVVCCRVLLDGVREFVSRTGTLSKIDNTWHHQGTFYRRAAHLGYDVSYRICADFDHNQKLLKGKCTVREIPAIVADHAGNGISMREAGRGEIYRSVRSNYGHSFLLLSKLRFALRGVRGWLRKLRATKGREAMRPQ